MMDTILVTGGAGNIGSALVRALAKLPLTEVVIADNLLTGSLDKIRNMSRNVTFVKCDVNDFTDISSLFYRFRFTHVFHFAAVVGVQRTLANPLMVLRDATGIENVLRLCKNTGVKRVYFASSSEVYGEPFEVPQNENTTPLNSRLPYAVVKNLGEVYLRTYEREFGLPYTIFRFFNTYGPDQSEDFVVPRFVRAALRGDPLTIYGDGSQTRTFCYVDDTVEACVAAHVTGQFINDVVNIGSDQEISILELARMVIRITGSDSKIVHFPPLREGDMTRRRPDVTKMRKLLSRPLIPLEEGIRRLAQHYLERDGDARLAPAGVGEAEGRLRE
ncbi:MAG TPA: SDR family NAD(P)-dependent oxidoreductase [Longimicrobiales bacterium]